MQTQLTLNLGIEEKVDVRSLIVHGDIERDTPKAKREQPAPEFERVLMDGADCAFRRRCGSRSQMLVLLVTQGQYYVTDERTGSRHALTTARLGTFCKGATGDALTPPWSRQPLQAYDAKGRAAVVALLNSGDFREMCKRDMVRVEAWAASRMGANAKWNLSGTWEHASLVWRLVGPTMGHAHCREALSMDAPHALAARDADGEVAVVRVVARRLLGYAPEDIPSITPEPDPELVSMVSALVDGVPVRPVGVVISFLSERVAHIAKITYPLPD